jgi:hypothetical protein
MEGLGVAGRAARIGVIATALLTVGACGGAKDAKGGDSTAASGSVATGANTASSDDAGLRDATAYTLTMDKVNKYYEAMRNLAVATKNASPAEREAMNLNAADASLDDYVAHLQNHPIARREIERAGLTTREFAVLTIAILQSGMASAVIQMRPKDNVDSLAREMKVNPANVRFLRDHEAELAAKQKSMEAEMKAAGATQ